MTLNTLQFHRAYEVQAGPVKILSAPKVEDPSLRVVFSVERDRKHTPNNCELAIYNLAPDTRGALENLKELTLSLKAGYIGNAQEIFQGVARDVYSIRESTDYITMLSCGDGEQHFGANTIDKTFRAGTPVLTVLSALVAASGVGLGNLATVNPISTKLKNQSRTLQKAMTFQGLASTELLLFAQSLGLEYSVQSGALLITAAGAPGTLNGPLISPDTGLLGSVSIDADGNVSGRAYLLPDLVPGVLFQVETSRVKGAFVATRTVHAGDSHQGAWTVDFEGAPL